MTTLFMCVFNDEHLIFFFTAVCMYVCACVHVVVALYKYVINQHEMLVFSLIIGL